MTMHLEKPLLKRKEAGNLRHLKVTKDLVDFSSNDYLGLAKSPFFIKSVLHELNQNLNSGCALGSTGSRLLTGNSNYAEDLEHQIAAFHGYEAGVLFGCGYMANIGLLSALTGSEDAIFFDVAVHASTYDGIRLNKAPAFGFLHNDCMHLEKRLKNCSQKGSKFICIESIYSTSGSVAPLKDIYEIAGKYGANLIVDEAHAVGVFGPGGRGLVAEQNLSRRTFAQIVTFGKALGSYGAIILGSNLLKQSLINFSRPCIYTTALPLTCLAAIKQAYKSLPFLEKEMSHLKDLIHVFRDTWRKSASQTHIQPIAISGNDKVKKAALIFTKNGFDVKALMSPAVGRGKEILRISLHAHNSESEVLFLLKLLALL